MKTYYAIWNGNEHRFNKSVTFNYTFPIEFPNIVLRTKNLEEAKAKIERINSKAKLDFLKLRFFSEGKSDII